MESKEVILDKAYEYLNRTVFDGIYQGVKGNSTPEFLALDNKNYNVLVGRGRIRTLRVLPNTNCQISPQ